MARNSITPEQLLKSFDEAPSSTVLPAKPTAHEKFYSHPPLLPGELIISQQDHVTCVNTFNYIAEGILHITTYRIIFAGNHTQHYLDQGEIVFADDEPEEVARRGHRYQTRSRHASFHTKLCGVRSCQNAETKQNKRLTAFHMSQKAKGTTSSLSRNLRHSQSMIRKLPVSLVLPEDDPYVKLRTMRPIISNSEHVDHSYEIVASIPLTSICEVKKFSKKNLPKDKQMFLMDGIEIVCSNIQSYRFCLGLQSTTDAESVMKVILRNSKVSFRELFCFSHKFSMLLPHSCDILDSNDASNFYKFKMEYDRLKLFPSEDWRIYDGRHPLQYPSETAVPASVTSEELIDVANFHRGSCFPAVCWRHKDSGAVLLRSSATCYRRGLRDSRCPADEKFLIAVSSCSEASTNKLVVFTEQVRQSGGGLLNSSQTQMTGQLTPEEGETFFYPNTKFIYGDGLPDYRAVKQSAFKLQAVLSSKNDDNKWLSSLDDTDWLSQISELLQTATQISVAMENDKSSVLISYEDGIDRTAQVASLAQLLLDPYYRTVSGFQVLIQKEWLSFGHKFYARALSPQPADDHSPVFLQWLDCVWQVLQQFPFSFQFNSYLLEVIAEHVYSSRFGTFIVNSECERDEEDIGSKTTSLWTWLNVVSMSDTEKFVNLRFNNSDHRRALHPEYRTPCLKLWSSFYVNRYRVDHVQDALKAAELQHIKLEEQFKEYIGKYSRLLHCLADLDSEDVSSKISFYTVTLSRALRENHSCDHLVLSHSGSNNLLSVSTSGNCASLDSSLGEEDPDVLKSSMTSTTMTRHMTRSRSLDDMLNVDMRQRKVLKKYSLKRRVGSSKFYTEEMLNVLNNESTNNVIDRPISEKYSSLKDYLDSTGIDHRSDRDVRVSETQCCGYMVKQGQVRKSWKKRWFVLDLNKKYLAYFESEKAESPKGAISCKAITRVYEHRKCGKSKRHFLFCVDTPDRTYTINAPSEQSMNIWMTCLNISPTAIELQRDQT